MQEEVTQKTIALSGFSGIPFSPEGSQPADASNKLNAVFRCTPSGENVDPGRPQSAGICSIQKYCFR